MLHLQTHPNAPKIIDLSIDGVSKDKSSQIPLDVFSVRFIDCRKVYYLCAVKVVVYKQYSMERFLKECIEDIMCVAGFIGNGAFTIKMQCFRDSGFEIRYFVGDAPILKKVKNMVSHTAFWGCSCCQAEGYTCKLKHGKEELSRRVGADLNEEEEEEARGLGDAFGRGQQGRRQERFDGGARVYPASTIDAAKWTHESLLEVSAI